MTSVAHQCGSQGVNDTCCSMMDQCENMLARWRQKHCGLWHCFEPGLENGSEKNL